MPVLSFPPSTMGLSRADFGNHVRERNGWIARKRSAQLNEVAVEQSAHRFPSIAAGSAGEIVGSATRERTAPSFWPKLTRQVGDWAIKNRKK